MPQTPCYKRSDREVIDIATGTARTAGDVVVIGTNLVTIVPVDAASRDVAAGETNGIWNVPKDSSDVTAGLPLYWDADGSPVGGTALSGAFSTNSALGPFGGFALEAAGTGVGDVDMILCSKDATVASLAAIPAAIVATGGNTISNSNAVTTGFTLVTGADNAAKAVRLPEAAAGKVCIIKSGTSGATLAVFPAVNDTINGGAANAVYNMANMSLRHYYAVNAVAWYTDEATPT